MRPDRYDDLDGRVAFVTGANHGIGHQVAANLRDRGATVYAGSRSITNGTPEETKRVLLDVTQEEDIEKIVDGIFANQNRLGVLINNTGVDGEGEDIVAGPIERVDRTFGVSLRGPTFLCKHAVPLLLQSDDGRAINVSSGMGALGEEQLGRSPAYRIPRTGLSGLTAYLDGQYGDDGLIANLVCPGWVRADMNGEGMSRPVERSAKTPTWLATFKPDVSVGKFWRDEEAID